VGTTSVSPLGRWRGRREADGTGGESEGEGGTTAATREQVASDDELLRQVGGRGWGREEEGSGGERAAFLRPEVPQRWSDHQTGWVCLLLCFLQTPRRTRSASPPDVERPLGSTDDEGTLAGVEHAAGTGITSEEATALSDGLLVNAALRARLAEVCPARRCCVVLLRACVH